jgi:membrane protein insertase Oxa1/YidC/SpoIIIJ
MMKYGMPLMMSVFMVALPSGLVLYILINSILTVFQNLYIKRQMA